MSTRKDRQAATLLESGLRQFHQGQLEQAQQTCKRALELVPRQPDALHILGVIALQRGDHARAVEILQRAVALVPDNPNYQANLAHAYLGLKRLPQALAAFERAARHEPDDPAFQLGVGVCLGLMGKAAEAERVLRRLVERHPRFAEGWFNLAKALEEQGKQEEACALYLRTTQLAPHLAEAYTNLGDALSKLQRYEEAEQAQRASLARNPGFAPGYVNLAITLNALRRHREAESMCREALRRGADPLGATVILGRSLIGQQRWVEALKCFEDAAAAHPERPDPYVNLGDVLAGFGRIEEALEALDRARSLGAAAPGTAQAQLAKVKARALFSAGRVREGAAEYIGREERRRFAAEHPDRPLATVLPEDMRGQQVCLVGEQGIGDQVFFLRYGPMLKARGCRVTFYGTRKIIPVLARSTVFDEAPPWCGAFAPADHTLFIGDLPHLIGGTLDTSPFRTRSVSPDSHAGALAAGRVFRWHCRVYWPEVPPPLPLQPSADGVTFASERLARLGPPPYVALTWRGGTPPDQQRGHVWALFKEIELEELAGALRGIKGTLISVQRNPRAGETERLAALLGRPVHDLSQVNEDLEAMLALLAVLDEYVGVSNTNMHLRASAGRTARVLVPWPAEWRWMISGDASPWFPGFQIYRQQPDGDWSVALNQLTRDLQAKFAGRLDT